MQSPLYLGTSTCNESVGAASPQQHSLLQPISSLPLFSNRVSALILKAQMRSQGAKMIAKNYFKGLLVGVITVVSSCGQVGLSFIEIIE